MSDLDIELDGGRTAYFPGDTVSGTVRWVLPKEPSRIELVLFWGTAGKGTRDTGIVARECWEKPGAYGTQTFSFDLPTAPHSFAGRLVSLHWGIEAIAGKTRFVAPLTLSPNGQEIQLPEEPEMEEIGRGAGVTAWLKSFRSRG